MKKTYNTYMSDTDDNNDDMNSENSTKIKAEFGSLKLEIETEGRDECEELFNDTWNKVIDDIDEMSEKARERVGRGLE